MSIIVICGILVTLLALIFLPKNSTFVELPPVIQDAPQVAHNVSVGINANLTDLPAIKDITAINPVGDQRDSRFYVDENGTRHYVINAKDIPIVK